MNPILHDLHNKQWVWTAANAKQQSSHTKLATGFDSLDKVLSGGFPRAGMIHLQSPLGSGEMRLMLSVINQQQHQQKLYVFINPPFEINAEFLLAQKISLAHLVIIRPKQLDDALWSAEQCAKSGACVAIFVWQSKLTYIQVRKLENAAQKGACYCVWLDSSEQGTQLCNLPLSLSLSIRREDDILNVTVNKQKVGWAQSAVKIPLPFNSRTNRLFKQHYKPHNTDDTANVVSIHANR